jgi:hypothetical protein
MLFFSMVCIVVCIVINLRFLRLKSYNILDMEQEYSEEFSVCNVEQDYPCVCCSGAYDSFDSIDSVIEENQKVKNVEGIETASNEKPRKQRKSKGPATQEQIEERRIKPADKLKEQIAVIEERRAFQEQRFKEREDQRIEKKFKAAEVAFLRNERSTSEKIMDAYLKKIEEQEEAELQQSCPIMIKSLCELLKSGCATCSCTECRESRECRDDDGSVHSEDGLDLLTTTHV